MEFLIILIIIASIVFLVYTEKRVKSRIEKDAKAKGRQIIRIRNPELKDGENPFPTVDFWIGSSSHILGISGERIFYKIVEVNENSNFENYWVKVKTTFFIPFRITWKKL